MPGHLRGSSRSRNNRRSYPLSWCIDVPEVPNYRPLIETASRNPEAVFSLRHGLMCVRVLRHGKWGSSVWCRRRPMSNSRLVQGAHRKFCDLSMRPYLCMCLCREAGPLLVRPVTKPDDDAHTAALQCHLILRRWPIIAHSLSLRPPVSDNVLQGLIIQIKETLT
jgi:hypothetical protein